MKNRPILSEYKNSVILSIIFVFILTYNSSSQNYVSFGTGLNYKTRSFMLSSHDYAYGIASFQYSKKLGDTNSNLYTHFGFQSSFSKYMHWLQVSEKVNFLLGFSYNIEVSEQSDLVFIYTFYDFVPLVDNSIGFKYRTNIYDDTKITFGPEITYNPFIMGIFQKMGTIVYGILFTFSIDFPYYPSQRKS